MAKRTLTSIEIPQADSLENVRRVVEAIASGASSRKEISEKTDISVRHIDYAIHAAKSLGFLAATDAISITDTGRALAATATRAGPYATSEDGVHAFDQRVARRLYEALYGEAAGAAC